jgi:hypothetical protein
MLRAVALSRNSTVPASSSRPMNCRFGIGLSMISSITCSRVSPWRVASASICVSTSGVFT